MSAQVNNNIPIIIRNKTQFFAKKIQKYVMNSVARHLAYGRIIGREIDDLV